MFIGVELQRKTIKYVVAKGATRMNISVVSGCVNPGIAMVCMIGGGSVLASAVRSYAARPRLCEATEAPSTATGISFPPKFTPQNTSQSHQESQLLVVENQQRACLHKCSITHVTSYHVPRIGTLITAWHWKCCIAYQQYNCMSNIVSVSYSYHERSSVSMFVCTSCIQHP